jgi:hypothetical protein
MITRAERLRLFQFYARERDCVLCKNWPRAEKAARRWETTYFPTGICMRCDLAFWDGICVICDGPEEHEAFREACRKERCKPPASRRTGHELIAELRSKAAAEH